MQKLDYLTRLSVSHWRRATNQTRLNFELKTAIFFSGDLTFPILSKQPLTDYTCESEEYTATKEPVQWEYKVMCAYEGNLGDDDEPGNDKNKTCYVLIKLTETPTSKVGLIIGIIVLVIAVLVGVVALLG